MSVRKLIIRHFYVMLALIIISDVSVYAQVKTEYIQTYVDQYVPLPQGEMQRALEMRQAEYDRNLALVDRLFDYVLSVKSQTTDIAFLNELQSYQDRLKFLYNEDLSRRRNSIKELEVEIKEAVYRYNSKVRVEAVAPTKVKEKPSVGYTGKLGVFKYITYFDNPPAEENMREEKSAKSKVIFKCPKKASVYVIDDSDEIFSLVYVEGYTGYIFKYFLLK
jgi:hypothetical protein